MSKRERERSERSVPDLANGTHKDKFWSSNTSISKERWEEIFGKKKDDDKTK